MRLIRKTFILSYIVWGGAFTYAFGELTLKNVWFDLFQINSIDSSSLSITEAENDIMVINYQFEMNDNTYTGKSRVASFLLKERIGEKIKKITISYNSLFPQINFIKQLKMEDRNGKVGMAISGLFLILTIIFDLFADKQKWADRYTRVLNK